MSYRKFNRIQVFSISAAHMVHDIYSSFLAPLLPLLIEKMGLSLTMAASLDVVRRIPALFNPLLGLMAEKTEVKYFVIVTPAITAISMSLIGLSSSYVMLFILLFVSGISAALFHLPSPVMIKEASGNKIGTGMSWFMVGGESARTLGPMLVTAAVSSWGLEGIYRLMPLGLVASLILYIKLRNIEVNRPITKPKEKGNAKQLLKQYRAFFMVLTAFQIFQSGLKGSLSLYLPVYLVQQGESLWYAGMALSSLQAFGVLGVLLAGHFSDKIGRKQVLVTSSIITVSSMFLFLYSHNILLIAPLGLAIFSSGPILMASVQDTHTNMPTFMNSMYMTINFSVSSIVMFMVGLVGDHFGMNISYGFFTLMALGCIPSALALTRFTQPNTLDEASSTEAKSI